MRLVNQMLLLIAVFLFLKAYIYFIKRATVKLKNDNEMNKLSHGLVSRKDLSNVRGKVFIDWCTTFLENLDFKNIHIISTSCSDNVQILAYRNLKRVYVKCILCSQLDSDDEDNFEKVGRPELQKLVGTMEHDNIKYGYIITNGDFSSDAQQYAETLPPKTISLKLIDGCKLTRLHRQFQKQYVPVKLKMEVD
jgi:hypothetical protein